MNIKKCLLTFIIMLLTNVTIAAAPNLEEIIHRANQVAYYQGQDGRANVKMIINDAQGRTRTREFIILRRDNPSTDAFQNQAYLGQQKIYVYFTRPADVNKMVFMVHKKIATDDDRWLYLPALDLVKRIASTDKRSSFVGSDFLYEDVSGRNLNDDYHALISTDDNYYIIENTPINTDTVEFSKYIMYIHKTSFLPIQTEYYDKQGNVYKRYTALAVDTIDGHSTIIKSEAQNLKIGSSTIMEYSKVQYDIGLPDDIFTEQFLRKAPRKYLR